jgi:ABC-type transporter Mla MlaB component
MRKDLITLTCTLVVSSSSGAQSRLAAEAFTQVQDISRADSSIVCMLLDFLIGQVRCCMLTPAIVKPAWSNTSAFQQHNCFFLRAQ